MKKTKLFLISLFLVIIGCNPGLSASSVTFPLDYQYNIKAGVFTPYAPALTVTLASGSTNPNAQMTMTITANVVRYNGGVAFAFNSHDTVSLITDDVSSQVTTGSISHNWLNGVTLETYNYEIDVTQPWAIGQKLVLDLGGSGLSPQTFFYNNPYAAEVSHGNNQIFAGPVANVTSAPETPTYLLLGSFLFISLFLSIMMKRNARLNARS